MEKVSVIVPTRNEEKYIRNLFSNLILQAYPKEFLEILVVDGKSSDGTIEIIKEFASNYSHIKYFNNPDQTAPYALNIGIKHATGDVIIRVDAHSIYPSNYVSQLVHYLTELDADNVGGVWITTAANESNIANVIAEATSNRFGIGNALYRLVNCEIKQVDTVPFGCYRRDIFDKIGLFDEELTRNQDDEFNGRLINNGGKIYLIPSIKIIYFARENLSKMSKMFYQYGLFKPLVNKKLGAPSTIRQLVPPLFVLFLICLPILLFIPVIKVVSIVLIALYLVASLLVTFRVCKKKNNLRLIVLPVAFFLIHLSYGCGYLLGIVRFLLMNRMESKREIVLSR